MPKQIAYNLKPTKDCEGETIEDVMLYLKFKFSRYIKLFACDNDDSANKEWQEAEKHLKSYIKNLIKQQK